MILNGMPKPYRPLDSYAPFRRVTDDKFFIGIEAEDPQFDEMAVKAALEKAGEPISPGGGLSSVW